MYQLIQSIPGASDAKGNPWRLPLSEPRRTRSVLKRERRRRLQDHPFNPDHLVIVIVPDERGF